MLSDPGRRRAAFRGGPLVPLAALALTAAAVSGCSCGDENGLPDDGEDGGMQSHMDGSVPGSDGGSRDAGRPPVDAWAAACDEDHPCPGDSRCVDGFCRPYGDGGTNEGCAQPPPPGPMLPSLQCAFERAPTGDPMPNAISIRHTPLVANLGIPSADPTEPTHASIVYVGVPSTAGCTGQGVLRVLDGDDCRQQAVFYDGAWLLHPSVTPAIGDLDPEAHNGPEIIAAAASGGLVAFNVDSVGGTTSITRRWSTTLSDEETPDRWGPSEWGRPNDCLWGGVSLYDLNDDGVPEVFFEGAVWDSDGVRITTVVDQSTPSVSYPVIATNGAAMVIGDFDSDGKAEVVAGNYTWEYDRANRRFVRDDVYRWGVGVPSGYVAVAELAEVPGRPANEPEIVVVMNGSVFVTTLEGQGGLGGTALATIVLEGNEPTLRYTGGPPTVADFDGLPGVEIGVAGGIAYEVFKLEPATGGGFELRQLWSQVAQDQSSNRTGSSVFDFNYDGRAEVVYADECFARVYDGRNGDVLFSQGRASWTWLENQVVANVDGDSPAEFVVGSSDRCASGAGGPACPLVDPIDRGVRCELDSHCPTGGVCDQGFCRCDSNTECPANYLCSAPLEGTPGGTGNVCRAQHVGCEPGIRIYEGANGLWASSRPIWNQHAYHVTNVGDDGVIPRTSETRPYWLTPRLNSFRQNVQRLPDSTEPSADVTVQSISAYCGDTSATTDLSATICNRGNQDLEDGIAVSFYAVGADGESRTPGCEVTIATLDSGQCTRVECAASLDASGLFEVEAEDQSGEEECEVANNSLRTFGQCVE
nr:VCBS repeat-containing protein [Sandaracinus sp.]